MASIRFSAQRVATLPPHSAVYFGLLVVDGAGVPHEGLQALAEEQAESLREQQAMLDEQLDDKQEEMGEIRQYVTDRQQRVHAVQMEVLKLTQAIERYKAKG